MNSTPRQTAQESRNRPSLEDQVPPKNISGAVPGIPQIAIDAWDLFSLRHLTPTLLFLIRIRILGICA